MFGPFKTLCMSQCLNIWLFLVKHYGPSCNRIFYDGYCNVSHSFPVVLLWECNLLAKQAQPKFLTRESCQADMSPCRSMLAFIMREKERRTQRLNMSLNSQQSAKGRSLGSWLANAKKMQCVRWRVKTQEGVLWKQIALHNQQLMPFMSRNSKLSQ